VVLLVVLLVMCALLALSKRQSRRGKILQACRDSMGLVSPFPGRNSSVRDVDTWWCCGRPTSHVCYTRPEQEALMKRGHFRGFPFAVIP